MRVKKSPRAFISLFPLEECFFFYTCVSEGWLSLCVARHKPFYNQVQKTIEWSPNALIRMYVSGSCPSKIWEAC